jgi:hypothetical protein
VSFGTTAAGSSVGDAALAAYRDMFGFAVVATCQVSSVAATAVQPYTCSCRVRVVPLPLH